VEQLNLSPLDLKKFGYCKLQYNLPEFVKTYVIEENWELLDTYFQKELMPSGSLYRTLTQLIRIDNIEHMLSLRQAPDEDGIWHDDGSRELGFSLSLCLDSKSIKNGAFLLKRKDSENLISLPPGNFGTLTCFQTGLAGYEHKVEATKAGKRLMLVGWINNYVF
jgi:hypothetical protein